MASGIEYFSSILARGPVMQTRAGFTVASGRLNPFLHLRCNYRLREQCYAGAIESCGGIRWHIYEVSTRMPTKKERTGGAHVLMVNESLGQIIWGRQTWRAGTLWSRRDKLNSLDLVRSCNSLRSAQLGRDAFYKNKISQQSIIGQQ